MFVSFYLSGGLRDEKDHNEKAQGHAEVQTKGRMEAPRAQYPFTDEHEREERQQVHHNHQHDLPTDRPVLRGGS